MASSETLDDIRPTHHLLPRYTAVKANSLRGGSRLNILGGNFQHSPARQLPLNHHFNEFVHIIQRSLGEDWADQAPGGEIEPIDQVSNLCD